MKKPLLVFLLLTAFMSGCGIQPSDSADINQTDANATSVGQDISFTYFYHGFLIQTSEHAPVLPDGICILSTEEEHDDFFTTYSLSSVYPLDKVDFDAESLVYIGCSSAQLFRGWSGKIETLRVLDSGALDYRLDEAVNFNKEHEDESVAYQMIGDGYCDVREVFLLKVQKSALPDGLAAQYPPIIND